MTLPSGVRDLFVPALLATVFFFYPIPGISQPKNLALLALLISAALTWFRRDAAPFPSPSTAATRQTLFVFVVLGGWMAAQSTLLAVDRSFSLNDFAEEWLVGVALMALIGWSVARPRRDLLPHHGITFVTLACFAHAAWMLAYQGVLWHQQSGYPFGWTPYAEKDFISYPISLAFTLLLSDLVVRVFRGSRLLALPFPVTAIALSISVAAMILVYARNGILAGIASIAVLGVLLATASFRQGARRSALLSVLIPALLIAGLTYATVTTDKRWEALSETVSIATDTTGNRYWLDSEKYALPLNSAGLPVDESAYLRIAWGTIALEGIAAHPLGYGYGLGAFGTYVEEAYGKSGMVSSHSGILDFTLANGIPGLLLWLLLCGVLLWHGTVSFLTGNPWGLPLVLVLTNFFTRTVLDGHFGGFRLKAFALLMGVLFYLATRPATDK